MCKWIDKQFFIDVFQQVILNLPIKIINLVLFSNTVQKWHKAKTFTKRFAKNSTTHPSITHFRPRSSSPVHDRRVVRCGESWMWRCCMAFPRSVRRPPPQREISDYGMSVSLSARSAPATPARTAWSGHETPSPAAQPRNLLKCLEQKTALLYWWPLTLNCSFRLKSSVFHFDFTLFSRPALQPLV